jgi:hypothetical protein
MSAKILGERAESGALFITGYAEGISRFHCRGIIMSANGNWNLVISTPMGERQATLSVKAQGAVLTGSQSAEGNSADIFDGHVNEDTISWKVAITNPLPMTLEFSGAIEGDSISGTVVLGKFGSSLFSGTRA